MATADHGAAAGSTTSHRRASWKHLFAFTRRKHCVALAPAILAAFAVGAFKTSLAVAFGQFFQHAVDFSIGSLSPRDALTQVEGLCILLCGLGAGHWAANTAFLSSWVIFGELQARSAREHIFESLLDKDIAWYDGQSDGTSSLLVRIETQIRELQLATSQVFGFLISDAFVSIACIAVSFYMSWRLTLVLLATLPVSVIILTLVTRRLQPAIQAQKTHLAGASKYANSAITGIDIVKIYNGFDYEIWKYHGAIKASMKQYLIQAHCNAMQMGYAKFWVISLFAVGFWYGIVLVSQGATAGQILTTFYATLTAFQGIEALMPQWLVLAKGMSAGQALLNTQMAANDSKRRPGGMYKPPACAGAVEAHDVSFAYPSNPDQIVLSKSSFVFPAGQVSFIVGRSGSGKSTLGNLLVNFYRPLTGTITIDGYEIRSLDDHWIRSSVTLIQQTSVLFNETFFMNVAFGHRSPAEATIDDVKKACDAAVLQSTLAVMPQGLNTMVGPGGYNLSGGQKQRLALARARLRDPPVLILDEVTSGLDPASKVLVMEAIRTWRRDKTTIIITHDVSQIRDDDHVFVMDKSRLVQEGTRKLIAENDGLFASLLAASGEEEMDPRDEEEEWMMPPMTSALNSFYSSESLPRWDDQQVDTRTRKRRSSVVSDMITRRLDEATSSREYGFGRRNIGSSLGDATARATSMKTKAIWDDDKNMDRRRRQDHRRSTFDEGQFRPWDRPRQRSRARSERVGSRRSSMEMVEKAGHDIRRTRIGATRSQRIRSPLAAHDDGDEFDDGSEKKPGTADTGKTDPSSRDGNLGNESAAPLSIPKLFGTVWFHLTPPERLRLVAGIVLCGIVGAASPLFSYCFAWLLSAFWADTDDKESRGRVWAILLIVIAVADGLAIWLGRYLMEYAGQAWVNALRLEGLKRILRQPRAWFDRPRNSAGRITECMDRDAEEMRNLVGRFAPILIIVTVMVLTAMVWALSISWKLTLVALSGGPAILIAVKAFSYTSTRWETKCNQGAGDTSAVLTEAFTNIRVVKALTLEEYMASKYRTSVRSTFKLGVRRAVYTSPLFGFYQSINFFLVALVFYYAMVLVARNFEANLVQIQQVCNLLLFCMGQAGSLLGTVPQIAASRATAAQMLRYVTLPDHNNKSNQGQQQPQEQERKQKSGDRRTFGSSLKKLATPLPIRMCKLQFAYPSRPNVQVIRNLSLQIDAGTCTAVVGSSGCGKSTLISLIMTLYEPRKQPAEAGGRKGEESEFETEKQTPVLSFNGVPFWQVEAQHLRTMMAFVPQAPFIFPGTVTENIAYGLKEMSPLRSVANLRAAAAAAGIDEFVMSLPEGYGTVIGDGGQAVSGGQAQRICLARALARRPKVLVMDEPTSALDAETAEMVRGTIRRLVADPKRKGMAVVLVTHSKEMMQLAERVVVLDGGRVVEEGGYEELKARGGEFARLIGGL